MAIPVILSHIDQAMCSIHGYVPPDEGCWVCEEAAEQRRRSRKVTVGDLEDAVAKIMEAIKNG